jgi:phosphatidate phosphatase APP1
MDSKQNTTASKDISYQLVKDIIPTARTIKWSRRQQKCRGTLRNKQVVPIRKRAEQTYTKSKQSRAVPSKQRRDTKLAEMEHYRTTRTLKQRSLEAELSPEDMQEVI